MDKHFKPLILTLLLVFLLQVLVGCGPEERVKSATTGANSGDCEVLNTEPVEWSDAVTRDTEVLLCPFDPEPCIVFRDPVAMMVELHCEISEWP